MRKVVMLALALAGCSQGKPVMPQLVLQPILYPDMVSNKLYGPACNFVASGGGMGAVMLAQERRAVIKIDDHVVAIPAAADGAALPQGAHTRYAGPLYSATLTPIPGGKHSMMGALAVFAGHLTITDAKAQSVYDATGDVQCRPS
jgi:hypothetical protein